MTPDSPKTPREELEARLTALLLGELSAEEAAALRHAIGQDPELARLESQLKETIGLVREATASMEEKTVEPAAPLQLSSERREKLLASFKTTQLEIPSKPRRKLRLNRELLKLAAMVVALLVMSGVVISYFAPKAKSRAQRQDRGFTLKLWSGEDSAPAQVTTLNGSGPTVVSVVPPDASSERANDSVLVESLALGNKPKEAPANMVLPNGGADAGLLPPPAARPTPADKQLAQNAVRFRSTIALPTSSEPQQSGTTPSDAVEGLGVGTVFAGVPEYAGVSVDGRSGLAGRPGGYGGGGGGFGLGGGRGPVGASEGRQSGRIPDPGQIPVQGRLFGNSTSGKSEQFGVIADAGIANVGKVPATQPLGELAGAKPSGPAAPNMSFWDTGIDVDSNRGLGVLGGQTFAWAAKEVPADKTTVGDVFTGGGAIRNPQRRTNFTFTKPRTPDQNSDWFAAKDVNGPVSAPAQPPVGRASPRANSANEPAPAIAANPAPVVDPATGLPAGSTADQPERSRLGSRNAGAEAVRRPVPQVVTSAPPLPPPPNQTVSPGTYLFALTKDDVAGLRSFDNPTQEAQGQVAASTGLPVAGVVVNSKSLTAKSLSREGAEAAPEKNVAAASVIDEDDAVFRKGGEVQKLAMVPPPPASAAPAPAALPTLKAPEKADAKKLLSDIDGLAQKREQDSPKALITDGVVTSLNSPLVTGHGQHLAGVLIADPTKGAGDGQEWGLQQKVDVSGVTQIPDQKKTLLEIVDADGDFKPRQPNFGDNGQDDSRWNAGFVLRLPQNAKDKSDRLTDLTRSGRRAPAEAKDKLAKVEQGGAGGAQSANEGMVTNGVSFGALPLVRMAYSTNTFIVADKERKEESEIPSQQTFLVLRTNGSAGQAAVNFNIAAPAADQKGKNQVEPADNYAVTMSRVDGRLGGEAAQYKIIPESAAKLPGQVNVGGDFNSWIELQNGSEESLSRKRVEIALPPGGANVQGVEREPRVQTGPVAAGEIAPLVINESHYHPADEKKPADFSELGEAGERRTGTNRIQISGVIGQSPSRTGLSTGGGIAGVGAEQAQQRSSFAQRLNQAVTPQTANRAASGAGAPGISGKAEVAEESGERLGAQLNQSADQQATPEETNKRRSYYALKRELDTANLAQQQIQKRVWQEKVEEAMPRSGNVQIIDRAEAPPAKSSSFWGRIGGAFSGDPVATARIAAEKDASDIGGLSGERTNQGFDPYWVQPQFEKIQSKAVLEKVIEKLDLNDAWAKEHGGGNKLSTADTLRLLKKKLDVRTKPNSSLIDIRVKDNDGDEAARIANTVAEAYLESRREQSKEMAAEGYRKLAAEQAALDKNIVRLKDELERRGKELKSENVSGNVESLQKAEAAPVQEFVDVVIPLKTAPAADVVRMLNSRAAAGELPVAGQTKIIVDERTNSLLIFASRNDLNSISNAIRRLDAPVPQGEVETAENAFSTFSLNVSDVSFKLAAASLEKGQMPDVPSVRSEEFINAFDYRDPEPKGSAPIAFAWERARYPFAHNRDLLRFSVKTAASGRQPGRPLNLVLLLDNSGSMERADRVRVIRECIRVLTGQLQPQDRVSVVAFARTARLAVDGLTGTNIATLPQEIGQLAPDGGTNLEDAMNVAYQAALKHFLPNGVNRVVLLTDGAANLGDVEPESLKKKVEMHRKQGVALDCFGIGWDGYNDDLLEVLSRNGDGRYGFVNTPEAAASEFAGQLAGALRVAASDVKVQVQFNPRRVTAYRQIGYAKHQLKKEQFRDNTVDAAEIGAAEQGNALYTVQVNPNGEGPLGVVRVRFKVPGTSDYREHEWALPYSGAATPLEQSSAPMRLAATASAFSEWLVSSPFAGEVTPDRLLGYLSGVPESCAADPRPKKLEWMIRQAKSLSGK